MSAAGAAAPTGGGVQAEITGRRVLAIALPVVVSNATVPLQGAIDTAIIGNLGQVTALAAVGLGATIFSLLFGVFNFLQIGASGLSAQALGARDMERVALVLLRACCVALVIALGLILLQVPLRNLGLALFEASAETEALAAAYVDIRIWGAPAELMNYALLGWFTGQETTRRLFQHQVVLASLNVSFNLLFVIGFGWGVEGVALGTVLASYLGLGYGVWLARGRLAALLPRGWRPDTARLFRRDAFLTMMTLNRDIFIRTLLLIGAFAWMTRLGSQQGDEILAANVVLWQFFEVSAYALDGFAMAAETLVGQAIGARSLARLDRSVRLTTLWSGGLAAAISLIFFLASGPIIDVFTTAPEVRATAREFIAWAAFVPLAGFLAFQMDGVFVGATGSREMRDAMIWSALFYFPTSWLLADAFGNHGLWLAVWLWLLFRAGALYALYPRVRARAARDAA